MDPRARPHPVKVVWAHERCDSMALTTTPCAVCGMTPTLRLTIRRHIGMILVQRFISVDKPLCRTHGRHYTKLFLNKTLVQGWWACSASSSTSTMSVATSRCCASTADLTSPHHPTSTSWPRRHVPSRSAYRNPHRPARGRQTHTDVTSGVGSTGHVVREGQRQQRDWHRSGGLAVAANPSECFRTPRTRRRHSDGPQTLGQSLDRLRFKLT